MYQLPKPYMTGPQPTVQQFQKTPGAPMAAPVAANTNPMAGQTQQPAANPMMGGLAMLMKGQNGIQGNPLANPNGANAPSAPSNPMSTDPNFFAGNQYQDSSAWPNWLRDMMGANTSVNYGVPFGPAAAGQSMPQLAGTAAAGGSFFPSWLTSMFM